MRCRIVYVHESEFMECFDSRLFKNGENKWQCLFLWLEFSIRRDIVVNSNEQMSSRQRTHKHLNMEMEYTCILQHPAAFIRNLHLSFFLFLQFFCSSHLFVLSLLDKKSNYRLMKITRLQLTKLNLTLST